MYFTETNKIVYGDSIVTDITKRTNIINNLLKNRDFYYEYVVNSGDTAETIAFDHYGDQNLHWIIFLINEIYDPLYQWFMTYNETVAYAKLKYGDPAFQETQYWLFNGVKYKIQPNITLDPNGLAVAVSNLDFEVQENDKRQTIKIAYPQFTNQIVAEFKEITV